MIYLQKPARITAVVISLATVVVSLAALIIFTGHCRAAKPQGLPQSEGIAGDRSVTVLFYNVQNLFDTVHEEGKNDWAFLPAGHHGKKQGCQTNRAPFRKQCLNTDWTPGRLQIKLQQLRRVLTDSQADIAGLAEVENSRVLHMLCQNTAYSYVLLEGPDRRGIDTALLYRTDRQITVISKRLHLLHFKDNTVMKTRGILDVHVNSPAGQLRLLVNHWPSRYGKNSLRRLAADTLFNAVSKAEPGGLPLIAMGDFNTDARLIDSADEFGQLHTLFVDVHEQHAVAGSVNKTYFYAGDNSWLRTDRFLISKPAAGRVLSYQIMTTGGLLDTHSRYRRPARYNHNSDRIKEAGFSDHLPVVMTIAPTQR